MVPAAEQRRLVNACRLNGTYTRVTRFTLFGRSSVVNHVARRGLLINLRLFFGRNVGGSFDLQSNT